MTTGRKAARTERRNRKGLSDMNRSSQLPNNIEIREGFLKRHFKEAAIVATAYGAFGAMVDAMPGMPRHFVIAAGIGLVLGIATAYTKNLFGERRIIPRIPAPQ